MSKTKNKILNVALVTAILLALIYALGVHGRLFVQFVMVLIPFVVIAYFVNDIIDMFRWAISAYTAKREIRHLRKLNEDIGELSPSQFERYVETWLIDRGYETELTEYYDKGIDIIAVKDGVYWGVQVKHWSSPVGIDAVRQAVTALKHYKCSRAMVVTNSVFYASAKQLAKENDCYLIDGYDLRRYESSINNIQKRGKIEHTNK